MPSGSFCNTSAIGKSFGTLPPTELTKGVSMGFSPDQLAEKPVEKHIALHRAIEDIDQIHCRLESLITRVEGPRPEVRGETEGVGQSDPTLREVLDHGAEAIRMKIADTMQRIEYLESIIF